MSMTKCLIDSLQLIERDDTLDPQLRQEMIDGLKSTINRYKGDAQAQARKAILRAQQANRDEWVARVSKAFSEAKEEELREKLAQVPVEDRARWLRDFLEYSSRYDPQNEVSVAKQVRAEEAALLGALNDVLKFITDDRPVRGLMARDSESAPNFHMELRGVDSGDAQARKLAAQYREIVRPYLESLRENGVWVEEMQNHAPQTHDIASIMADLQGWRQYLRDHLDPDFHPDVEATIDRIEDTLTLRDLDGNPTAKTITMSRKVRFRTPQAEYDYNARFGEKDFHALIIKTARALARNKVIAERLGPSPKGVLDRLITETRAQVRQERKRAQEAGDTKRAKLLEKVEARTFFGIPLAPSDLTAAHILAQGITGEILTPESQDLANLMTGIRNTMTISMLGQVAFSAALQDSWIGFIGSRFANVSGSFGSGFSNNVRAIREVLGDERARAYAEDVGVFYHHAVMSNASRLSTAAEASGSLEDGVRPNASARLHTFRDMSGKIAAASQRAAGANYVDATLRSGYFLMSSRQLMRALKERNWGDLHERFRKMLEANAIDETYWKRLQRNAKEVPGLGAVDLRALPPDLFARVNTMLYREADLAVVYPGMYDRLALNLYTRPGTWSGELVASETQFLSWPMAFLRGPMMRELRHGGYGAIGFGAAMIASGAATIQAYEMLNNRPRFEWDSPDLWQRAVVRSGLLTPVGEMVLGQVAPGGPQRALLEGPVLSVGARVLNQAGMGTMDLIDGDTGGAARRFMETVDQAVLPNTWWLNWSITSRAMEHALPSLDPEAYAQQQRRYIDEQRVMD